MTLEEYINVGLDRDEELCREYEALESRHKKIEEEISRIIGYCEYTFPCMHKSECGPYCCAKFNCEHKVKDLAICRVVGVRLDGENITDSIDDCIHVYMRRV